MSRDNLARLERDHYADLDRVIAETVAPNAEENDRLGRFPRANLDAAGRLRVAAAVGVEEDERVERLALRRRMRSVGSGKSDDHAHHATSIDMEAAEMSQRTEIRKRAALAMEHLDFWAVPR